MKILYSCNFHLIYVIEEFVDQYHSAPILEVINSSQSCYWCGKRAIYRLQLAEKKEGVQDENPPDLCWETKRKIFSSRMQ